MSAARFMLDTDTSSYIMKRSHPSILDRLRKTPISDVCISVVTKAELYYGVAVSPRREHDSIALLGFLRYIEVLDFPDDAASHYGEIRGFLKETAQMIGANDLFLAAHARCLDMTIVTNNTRHFGRVPSLKLDNWVNR